MRISILSVPEASLVLRRVPEHLTRFCASLGLGLSGAALVWGVAIYALLPSGLGAALLGSISMAARRLLPPITLAVARQLPFSTAPTGGLRAMGAARRSLTAELVAAGLHLTCGVVICCDTRRGGRVLGARGRSRGRGLGLVVPTLPHRHQLRRAGRPTDRRSGDGGTTVVARATDRVDWLRLTMYQRCLAAGPLDDGANPATPAKGDRSRMSCPESSRTMSMSSKVCWRPSCR